MVISAGLEPIYRDVRGQSLGWADALIERGDATYVARAR